MDDESERESVQTKKNLYAESACRTTFAQNFELSIKIEITNFSNFCVCRFMMEQDFKFTNFEMIFFKFQNVNFWFSFMEQFGNKYF